MNMTTKQKKLIEVVITEPTLFKHEQGRKAGYSGSNQTVTQTVNETLKNPEVVSALAQHNDLFESTITGTVKDWARSKDISKRGLAVNTAKWGYEQIHGKATQRTESVSASFIQHTSTKAKEYGL